MILRVPLLMLVLLSLSANSVAQQEMASVTDRVWQYYEESRLEEARALLDSLLESPEELSPELRFELFSAQSYVLMDMHAYSGSIAAFHFALQIDPSAAPLRASLGWVHYLNGSLDSAVAVTNKALATDETMGWAWANLGLYQLAQGDMTESLQSYYTACTQIGEDDADFWTAIYADLDQHAKDHPDQAAQCGRARDYLKSLSLELKANNLAPQEARKALEEVISLRRRVLPEVHPDLARSLINLAWLHAEQGRLSEAEPLLQESLAMFRRIYTEDHPDLAASILNMGMFLSEMGRLQQALPLFEEALTMHRQLYDGDHPNLGWCLNSVGTFFDDLGNTTKAEALYEESLAMRRRIYEGDNVHLARSINNLAQFYLGLGRLDKAEPMLEESLAIKRRLYKEDHSELALSINNMAAVYVDLGRFEEAERLYEESLAMNRRLYEGDHPSLATALNNLGMHYEESGREDDAERLLREALDMRLRLYGEKHPATAASMNSIGMAMQRRDRSEEAEQFFVKALDMHRSIFHDDHPDLATSLFNLAVFYQVREQPEKAETLFREALDMFSRILRLRYSASSEREREQLLGTMSFYFEVFSSFALQRCDDNPLLLAYLFDLQLLHKGMLFESTRAIRRQVSTSGDTTLMRLFDTWRMVREQYARSFSMTEEDIAKRGIRPDSLQQLSNTLEKELAKRSVAFARGRGNPAWQQVRDALTRGEAAVELLRVRKYDVGWDGTVFYAALIITSETRDYPELVLLDHGEELEDALLTQYREHRALERRGKGSQVDDGDTELYEQYWEHIDDALRNAHTVYLSPDGVYNLINIGTLRRPDGRYLMESTDIHLISSTRDLIGRTPVDETADGTVTASLYGAPDYGLIAEERSAMLAADSRDQRGMQFNPLPNTWYEIEQIDSLFRQHGWIVRKHTGSKALEEVVKQEIHPRVLLFSTHGFFVPADVLRRHRYIYSIEAEQASRNPLLRSGLALAGANDSRLRAMEGRLSGEMDDGLLTAFEALHLDLYGTELVVLSACETGLGELRNGEGVYGLQRSFRTAGARSVLMSLWKVPDEQTRELMVAFFSHWLAGESKHSALKAARSAVREHHPEPYFWGAFVLVGD